MKRGGFLLFGVVFSGLVGAVILISCSQKEYPGDGLLRPNARPMGQEAPAWRPKEVTILEELKAAHFEYNKADLTEEAKKAMRENAAWLKKNPLVQVQIEGHCDERGSREFNYKLGEKRAENAKEFLISQGIDKDRIGTVSYGALSGQNEKTWRNNRRAVFVLIYPKTAE